MTEIHFAKLHLLSNLFVELYVKLLIKDDDLICGWTCRQFHKICDVRNNTFINCKQAYFALDKFVALKYFVLFFILCQLCQY